MGCASSKQPKCRHCHAPFSPMRRKSLSGLSGSYHDRYDREDDEYHVVALTSSTLGSIKLDSGKNSGRDETGENGEEGSEMRRNDEGGKDKNEKFMIGMIEAKAWSKMIDEKIPRVFPRTPVRTPTGEPEMIDVRELMDGLEDVSPVVRVGEHLRSFSFHVSVDSIPSLVDSPRVGDGCLENCVSSHKKIIGFDSREKDVVSPKETTGESDGLVPTLVDSSRGVVSLEKTIGVDSEEKEKNGSIQPLLESLSSEDGFLLNDVVSHKKTIWFDCQKDNNGLENDSLISKGLESEFDPEVIYAFRKALVELSPRKPFHLKPRDGVFDEEEQANEIMPLEVGEENMKVVFPKEVVEEKKLYVHVNGIVDRVITEEEKENLAPSENGDVCTKGFVEEDIVNYVQGAKKRVVLYFTSLRGVRKTYEDCCYVRLTLKTLRVRVDERDVSMHLGFKEELKELLGESANGCLPKVFIGDKYIGGTEEIRRLHEDGNVEKLFEGCEMLDGGWGNLIDLCEGCGDIRFVPCETCSGSCKIYYEYEEDDEEYEENEYGFQRCLECNENGLVRCPLCCY